VVELSMENNVCKADICTLNAYVRGYCSTHAKQEKLGIEFQPIGLHPRKQKTCDFPDCPRTHHSGGYCYGHYQQQICGREMRELTLVLLECSTPGCARDAKSKGLCGTHYNKLHNSLGECSFEGCGRGTESRGLCRTHADQMRNTGSLTPIRAWGKYTVTKEHCLVNSCNHLQRSCGLCPTHIATRYGYGLTVEELCELLNRGCCDVCQSTDRLGIDHDHACCSGDKSCGKCVRGLLCTNCNTALGHAKDDITRLHGLIAYLQTS